MRVDKSKLQKKTLEELCSKGSSNIVISKTNIGIGDYPLYGASGFIGNVDFYHNDAQYLGIVKDGSGVGRVEKYPAFSSLVGTMQYIYPKSEVDIDYLKYFLQFLDLAKYVQGAAIPHIYFRHYKDEKAYIPPFEIQKFIAAELDAIQAMIDGYREQLADLDALAQSIFLDTFGDPISNPKGWETKPLSSDCMIIRGPFGGSLKKECFVDNGYAVYEQQNAIYNRFNFRYFIDNLKFEELKRFQVKPNDIIMSCAGTMGKIAIIPPHAQKGIINQALMLIRANDNLNVRYLYFLLKSNLFQTNITEGAKGTAMKNIAAVGSIKQQKIPLPPLELQQQFASQVEAIEKQKDLLRQQIADAETLMAERMQYYFS